MAWDTNLEGVALNIARVNHTPLRVMAGPGTGKSFAMKRRVQRLLEQNTQASRILAVTFTRNAAAALVQDLHNMGVPGCDLLRCETLHSFCFRLLSEDAVFQYLGRTARPLMTFLDHAVMRFEANPLLADILGGQFGGKRECSKRIRAFEADWARLQTDTPGWTTDAVDAAFQGALLSWLRFHKAMLIGELVPETLRYLRSNPAAAILAAFDHVIVDEYQDLNKAEQSLLDLLSARGNQAVVGDVDQSIYSFRHANPEGIAHFDQYHPQTLDETLDACRRCPTRVVALADALIRNNHAPTNTPRLVPKAGNPVGEIHVVQWMSLQSESVGLAAYVRHLINDKHFAPGEILILSPRRLIGYGIRDEIKKLTIPVHSFYHEEALETEPAQQAFCLLMLAVNPRDRVALRFWLGIGSPTSRRNEYARLRTLAETSGSDPCDLLTAMAANQSPSKGMMGLVRRWNLLQQRLAAIAPLSLPDLIEHLLPGGQEDTETLREAAQFALPECEDKADLLDRIRAATTQPDLPENPDFVRVMSLHKSKGLTARICIVSGCIQGVIPVINSDETLAEQQATLIEQRRLFYVAITRCTELLVLSSASHIGNDVKYKIGALTRPSGTSFASEFMAQLGPQSPPAKLGEPWAANGYRET